MVAGTHYRPHGLRPFPEMGDDVASQVSGLRGAEVLSGIMWKRENLQEQYQKKWKYGIWGITDTVLFLSLALFFLSKFRRNLFFKKEKISVY